MGETVGQPAVHGFIVGEAITDSENVGSANNDGFRERTLRWRRTHVRPPFHAPPVEERGVLPEVTIIYQAQLSYCIL